MLESLLHSENCFATLTYQDEFLELTGNTSSPEATLNPKHLQDWLKRFREAIYPFKVRFFAVGEYGDRSERPHYHVVLFGYRGCLRGRTRRRFGTSASDPLNCCDPCRLLHSTWAMGNTEFGELNMKSASYIAEYAVKKMTRPDDLRLRGRHPEFARMSLKPGIGHDAMWEVSSKLMELGWDDGKDVPEKLNHGAKAYPLGPYLRRVLRKQMGREVIAPESTLQAIKEELQPLREAAKSDPATPGLGGQIAKASEQPIRNLEAKTQIHKRRIL